jgi:hypothetical protein
MFHIKHYNKFQELMLEENECDLDALRLILNSIEDADYLLKMKGVCIGLMIINVYGIHTGNYDGKSHPLTYDRLINNLKLFFGQENDKVWGFVVALFALHMTKEGLVNEENNQKEFNTFYDCILGYKTILEMHNSSK